MRFGAVGCGKGRGTETTRVCAMPLKEMGAVENMLQPDLLARGTQRGETYMPFLHLVHSGIQQHLRTAGGQHGPLKAVFSLWSLRSCLFSLRTPNPLANSHPFYHFPLSHKAVLITSSPEDNEP